MKDSEIMSLPCTSRPCIWADMSLLSLSKGVLTKTAAKKTSSFLQSYCCCPLPLITTFPDMSPWSTYITFLDARKIEKGSTVRCKYIPADQIRLQQPCGVSDCRPGSLHANQQQDITTNSIRFPLTLYQCKRLYSFYRASLFSLNRLPEGLP